MAKKQLAIIGGGASGMAAALEAAQYDVDVTLYEAGPRLGKKLMATGNGRCNFSHRGFTDTNFHGKHPHFVHEALAIYNEESTLTFFEGLGLATTIEEARDRYYPASLQASAVLDILRLSLKERGVKVVNEVRITAIKPQTNGRFVLEWKDGKTLADAVIVACGGEAGEKIGGTRDGYKLLQAHQHKLIPTAPGIVQLVGDVASLKAANGIKREAMVTILCEGKAIAQSSGELLITNYGLSGPVVLNCSAEVSRAQQRGRKTLASINFFPEMDVRSLRELFIKRLEAHPKRTAEEFFIGLLPRLLGQCALKKSGLSAGKPLKKVEADALARLLSDWRISIKGTKPLADAQVTVGGIDTADFDPTTMQSWIVPGLYACGEVLDVDGDCGGYNLQWAWSSGRLAGASAAQSILI